MPGDKVDINLTPLVQKMNRLIDTFKVLNNAITTNITSVTTWTGRLDEVTGKEIIATTHTVEGLTKAGVKLVEVWKEEGDALELLNRRANKNIANLKKEKAATAALAKASKERASTQSLVWGQYRPKQDESTRLPGQTLYKDAAMSEQAAVTGAELALFKYVETAKKTKDQVKHVWKEIEKGKLTTTEVYGDLAKHLIKLKQTYADLGKEERRESDRLKKIAERQAAVIKASKKMQKNLKTLSKKLREGVDLRTVDEGGRNSKKEREEWLKAEAALLRLRETSMKTSTPITRAMKKAKDGTLDWNKALTKTEKAALRMKEATDKLGVSATKTTSYAAKFGKTLANLGKVGFISLWIGGLFRLQQAFTDSIGAAKDLSLHLAEIATIEGQGSISAEEWASGLRDLSNAYGIDIAAQAEGAYQTLSNQMRNFRGEALQGKEVLHFLDAANRLAVTGLTDTGSAVNLLTSALNAFRLPSEDALKVSSQFFATVELGRVRVEEMANTLGRLAVPAKQMNISIEELMGSIAHITVQGVKFNEASTLIRNVILKLITPTTKMKEIFASLGVSTGEALIAQRGFLGTMAAIEKQSGGTTTELGKAFGRIRAITGMLLFSGEQADKARTAVKGLYAQTIEAFGKDTDKILQSYGKRLDILGTRLTNFFEKEVGSPMVASMVATIEATENLVKSLVKISPELKEVATQTKEVAKWFALIGIVAYTKQFILMRLAVAATAAEMSKTALAAARLKGAMSFLLVPVGGPIGAVAVAVTAAIAGAMALYSGAENEKLRLAEEANLKALAALQERKRRTGEIVREETDLYMQEFQKIQKGFLKLNADHRRVASGTLDVLAENFEELTRRFTARSKEFLKLLSTELSDLKSETKELEGLITKSGDAQEKTTSQIEQNTLARKAAQASLKDQFGLYDREIAQLRAIQEAALAPPSLGPEVGPPVPLTEEEFQERAKLLAKTSAEIEKHLKLREAAYLAYKKHQLDGESEIQQLMIEHSGAKTKVEKDALNTQIGILRAQVKASRKFSGAMLKNEKELQEARGREGAAPRGSAAKGAAQRDLSKIRARRAAILGYTKEENKATKHLNAALKEQVGVQERLAKLAEERKSRAEQLAFGVEDTKRSYELLLSQIKAFKMKDESKDTTIKEFNESVTEQLKLYDDAINIVRKLGPQDKKDVSQTEQLLLAQKQNTKERAKQTAAMMTADGRAKDLLGRYKENVESTIVSFNEMQGKSLAILVNYQGAWSNILEGLKSIGVGQTAEGGPFASGKLIDQLRMAQGGAPKVLDPLGVGLKTDPKVMEKILEDNKKLAIGLTLLGEQVENVRNAFAVFELDRTAVQAELLNEATSKAIPTLREFIEVLTALQKLPGTASEDKKALENITDSWGTLLNTMTDMEKMAQKQGTLVDLLEAGERIKAELKAVKAGPEMQKAIYGRVIDIYQHSVKLTDQEREALGLLNATREEAIKKERASLEVLKTISKELSPLMLDTGKIPTKKAEGGTISGPPGRDVIPAMLTAGEFVVRASQARKYRSQLLAINSGRLRPYGFAEGGPVDVGGVNVTVNESSSPQSTARGVVTEINRGLRQGTLKFYRRN